MGRYEESLVDYNKSLEIIRGPTSYLEFRIQELANLIKNKKKKTKNSYRFFKYLTRKGTNPEINYNLEFKKAEKQESLQENQKKEFRKIDDELENKIGEEFMENIQLILKDCEELVGWEAEIEERLKVKILLIKERDKILQIINSNDGKKL
ncbi:hypothetical protein F8M41_019837 [Gigaspora margarita]|uniref:Uncharacterized protein n=1 Tax=Gigaspora margarita TaxID=4874 RepID=A0A8H4AJB5_GIGMA|nr:hypothetical protein F8M41_019837 [Gigaspora margarita]